MSLSGKLCIGILEEDNPLKSYFCFKPLLVQAGDRFETFAEKDLFPENGSIRIVPDKNESSHFKNRMRRIGTFAIVDLRAHPGENDKIRANKNYHAGGPETNAYIIYSDVIREPGPRMLCSVLDIRPENAENAVLSELPALTTSVLSNGDGIMERLYRCAPDDHQPDTIRLTSTDESVDAAGAQLFDLDTGKGNPVRVAVFPAALLARVETPIPAFIPHEITPAPAPAPAARVVPPMPPRTESVYQAPQLTPPMPARRAPEPAQDSASPHQRSMSAQSGLNPRRGRSLQEIIDEKWRHSRMDQLGTAVQDLSTGAPISSPLERLVPALKAVWNNRDQREGLISVMADLEGAEEALNARLNALRESAVNDQIIDLEAQRLKMLDDLKTLKDNGDAIRDELKQEIRRDEAAAFADAVKKTEHARAEQAKTEAALEQTRSAAQAAEEALSALNDGSFEAKLNEFAIHSRAFEYLVHTPTPKARPKLTGSDATAEELALRLRTAYSEEGCQISHTDAVNLLICAAQKPLTLICGKPGVGKSVTARLLARALGVEERFVDLGPTCKHPEAVEAVRQAGEGEVPGVVLLDDANLATGEDCTRGLAYDRAPDRITIATLQDEGRPLPGWLVGRCFLIRIQPEKADAPWQPRAQTVKQSFPAVSTQAFRSAFAPHASALPEGALRRMEKLRADLALMNVTISRAVLNDLWNYCTAAMHLMPLEAVSVLDLALSQRALPVLLCTSRPDVLRAMPRLFSDLPRCRALLTQCVPLRL